MDNETSILITILATFGLVIAVVVLVIYLFDAIARFKYFKARKYPNTWMAFIPIANVYGTIEATYGNVDNINIYGLQVPAVILKLYPLILSVVTGIIVNIPFVGSIGSTLVYVAEVAIGAMIFIDMMERLDKETNVGIAIVANLIPIIAAIFILNACKGIPDGQFDYTTDTRVLKSQSEKDGPLSGLNGKKNS